MRRAAGDGAGSSPSLIERKEYLNYEVVGDGAKVRSSHEADGRRGFKFSAKDGEGSMEVFAVFPGIELVYNDFSMDKCVIGLQVTGELLEINYCYEGREECRWVCGDYLYLGEGDLCITRMECERPELYFPGGYYRGITVVLDTGVLANNPLPVLEGMGEQISGFADKFCPGHHFFAMRTNKKIAHIFEELYEIPTELRESYFKIKVLELLLFLGMVDTEKERRIEQLTKSQSETVKAVREKICAHLDQNYTIAQLAREFCISETSLKTNFKMVFQDSIKEYLRKVRMEEAARLLRETNATVSQIAAQVGYTNQSKFAAVFKNIHGVSPLSYRKNCEHSQ